MQTGSAATPSELAAIRPWHRSPGAPEPRPYQVAAVEGVEAQWRAGVRRTLLVLPTGCGKTVVFAELVRRAVELGIRVLVVAHRTELLEQAAEKLAAVGVRAALEQGASKASLSAMVVVGSVQTLRGARLERYAPNHFGLIVIDEAHHAEAQSYQGILERFRDALVLGVTATPKRTDGKALGDTFESVAFTYELRTAIREQYLAPIRARRVKVDVDLSRVKSHHGDFDAKQLSELLIAEKNLHEFVSPLMELARGRKRVLVFAADVAHAKALAEVINRHEPGAAMAIDGNAKPVERRAVLGLFRRGAFRFLVNCSLFTEGFDEPGIDCIAMCRPTQSWALYTQMLGRGTRLLGKTLAESIAAGKSDVLVLDFVGNTKHALIGPADALAGGPLTEEQRAMVEKQIDEDRGQTELDVVLTHVDDEIAKKRSSAALIALVHYRQKEVDPFVGDFMPPLDPDSPAAKRPATEKQLEAIKLAGFSVPPVGLTLGEASAMLDAVAKRREAGLCSIAQMRLLGKYGLDCERMTAKRAGELIAKGRKNNWKPFAFLFEPEKRKSARRTG